MLVSPPLRAAFIFCFYFSFTHSGWTLGLGSAVLVPFMTDISRVVSGNKFELTFEKRRFFKFFFTEPIVWVFTLPLPPIRLGHRETKCETTFAKPCCITCDKPSGLGVQQQQLHCGTIPGYRSGRRLISRKLPSWWDRPWHNGCRIRNSDPEGTFLPSRIRIRVNTNGLERVSKIVKQFFINI